MPTSLVTYQRLALSELAALSLRKHAARRLLSLEQGLDVIQSERLLIEGCMRDESSTARRPGMVGAVNATSESMGASERPRVRDSHDARPGSARASERPYSVSTFTYDVATGRPAAALCGVCTTRTAPLWALELDPAERAKLSTAPRKFADPSDESSERAPSVRQRANDARAEQAARLRELATVADESRRA